MEVSGQLPISADLPPWKVSPEPIGGPQNRSRRCGEEKNRFSFFLNTVFETGSVTFWRARLSGNLSYLKPWKQVRFPKQCAWKISRRWTVSKASHVYCYTLLSELPSRSVLFCFIYTWSKQCLQIGPSYLFLLVVEKGKLPSNHGSEIVCGIIEY